MTPLEALKEIEDTGRFSKHVNIIRAALDQRPAGFAEAEIIGYRTAIALTVSSLRDIADVLDKVAAPK